MASPERPDRVDEIIAQWERERPAVDVSAVAIIGRLGRIAKVVQRRLDGVFAQHDLESWEFDVLATLLRSGPPHQMTPGQLLDSMMITSGAITNRIQRLEKRGMVERSRSPTDGRQVLVTLTPAGLAKVDAALIDHAANELEIVSALTQRQQDQLARLLRALHHSVLDLGGSGR